VTHSVLALRGTDLSFCSKVFPRIKLSSDIQEAALLIAQDNFDYVILPYSETAFRLAKECIKKSAAVWLLICPQDEYSILAGTCFPAGILLAPEGKAGGMVGPMLAMNTRISRYATEHDRLQQKIDGEKEINRAKLLLMSRLQMSEAEAHRYIEKTAMDTSVKLREVAYNIIKTYEG